MEQAGRSGILSRSLSLSRLGNCLVSFLASSFLVAILLLLLLRLDDGMLKQTALGFNNIISSHLKTNSLTYLGSRFRIPGHHSDWLRKAKCPPLNQSTVARSGVHHHPWNWNGSWNGMECLLGRQKSVTMIITQRKNWLHNCLSSSFWGAEITEITLISYLPVLSIIFVRHHRLASG